MKNTASEMRNIPDGVNNKLDFDEEKSTKLKDTGIVQIKTEGKQDLFKKMKAHL